MTSDSPPAPVHPPPTPLGERDDEALMLLAAGGHRAAFEVLAGRHLPRLSNYCAKFLGNAHAGEEIAQEVLVETWVHRMRYRSRGRFQVFLVQIARNRCLNRARSEGRRRAVVASSPPPDDSHGHAPGRTADQLDRLLEDERRRRVREALLSLPVKHREAVLLRFDQGLEYSEIAQIVGRPEATVRSRVFHALRRLRAELEEEDP